MQHKFKTCFSTVFTLLSLLVLSIRLFVFIINFWFFVFSYFLSQSFFNYHLHYFHSTSMILNFKDTYLWARNKQTTIFLFLNHLPTQIINETGLLFSYFFISSQRNKKKLYLIDRKCIVLLCFKQLSTCPIFIIDFNILQIWDSNF